MRTLIIIFICTIYLSKAKAQSFAVINDKDGFVNVRNAKSKNSVVIAKIYANAPFGYDEDERSNWVKIYQQTSIGFIEGYIDKSRIFPLSIFPTIKDIRYFKNTCIAVNDSLKIIIKAVVFRAKQHKLTYDKLNPTVLTTIDHRHFWGTDGEIPNRVISEVTINKNGNLIAIPKVSFDDLYEPSLKTLKIYIGNEGFMYVRMDNSDGAGGYSVIWIFKNGIYLKRYIDNINV